MAQIFASIDNSRMVEVVEYTDPICSWAWGTEPKLRLLRWRHGHRCQWRVVMGGLVGDASNRRADWDAVRAAEPMSDYWKRVFTYTGQPYPMPMHRMARSTDPAGRAVKAALRQGDDVAARMLRRLRESIFIFGIVPETPNQFVAAACGVPGLDLDRWLVDYADPASETAFRADWEETRRPNDHVRFSTADYVGNGAMKHSEGHDRYAFPTLIMRGPGGEQTVPGWMAYSAYTDALEAVCPGSTADPQPDPTPAEALERWGVLTENEFAQICGPRATEQLPADTVAHFWGAGLVYLTVAEASARALPTVTPADGRALADFAMATELVSALIAKIATDGWAQPTPCAEWDRRALVNHMVGGARMVAYGLTGRTIGPEFYGDHLGVDPSTSYREAADEVLSLYRADPNLLARDIVMPWGSLRGAHLATMFAADHLVHAWDAARSLGESTDFDHGLVARVRAFGDDYVAAHRGPKMFDAAVDTPKDAHPMDRLAAFVGRRL